jgi:hypothetical protein
MFKTFPEFSPLTLNDREAYESHMIHHPPLSDLSFATLMIWWNLANDIKVSTLNHNLVMSYHLPGDKRNSGLSLIGTHEIDTSIKTIFKELQHRQEPARLVHVPEFVVGCIEHPQHFSIAEEPDYHEYIIPVANFFPLEGIKSSRRWKVNKFLQSVAGKKIDIRSVDLADRKERQELITAMEQWGDKSGRRGFDMEGPAMQTTITKGALLGMRNLSIYIDNVLCGFVLFQVTRDGKYLIANHICVDYQLPRIFDYVTYICAKWAAEHDIPYLNFEMDLGLLGLREHKQNLGPIDFFRKYTIEPHR